MRGQIHIRMGRIFLYRGKVVVVRMRWLLVAGLEGC